MFSYSEISRWLTFNIDPIALEDWVANHEIFGKVDNPSSQDFELESAIQIELLRQKKIPVTPDLSLEVLVLSGELVGVAKLKDAIWLIAPTGKIGLNEKKALEIEITPDHQNEKIIVPSWQIRSFKLDEGKETAVKIDLKSELKIDGKSKLTANLGKCKKLIVDTRGRNENFNRVSIPKAFIIEWKGVLNEN